MTHLGPGHLSSTYRSLTLVALPGFGALGGIVTLLVTVEAGDMAQVFLSLVDSSSGGAAGSL